MKTNNCKPKNIIFGAGWEIIDKVLKSGFSVPPLIANFKWEDKTGTHQEIRFYPFIPKKHLKKHQLSETARRANYWMFNYIALDALPYFPMYKKGVQIKKYDKRTGAFRIASCYLADC